MKLTAKDIQMIKDLAGTFYKDKPTRLDVSHETFKAEQLAFISACIQYFNTKNLFKEVPEIDFTEKIVEPLLD